MKFCRGNYAKCSALLKFADKDKISVWCQDIVPFLYLGDNPISFDFTPTRDFHNPFFFFTSSVNTCNTFFQVPKKNYISIRPTLKENILEEKENHSKTRFIVLEIRNQMNIKISFEGL